MEGTSYSKQEYKDAVVQISREWANLSEDDQATWEDEAKFQQKHRDTLLITPLKTARQFDQAVKDKLINESDCKAYVNGFLGNDELRHWCEKASYTRLKLNQARLHEAPEMTSFNAGVQDFHNALRSCFVDLETSNKDIGEQLHLFFSSASPVKVPALPEGSNQKTTCYGKYGYCTKTTHAKSAGEYQNLQTLS